MKFRLIETDYGFFFDLSAENMEEAAKLVRLGMNATQKTRLSSTVGQSGEFSASLVVVKHNRANSYVQKRK